MFRLELTAFEATELELTEKQTAAEVALQDAKEDNELSSEELARYKALLTEKKRLKATISDLERKIKAENDAPTKSAANAVDMESDEPISMEGIDDSASSSAPKKNLKLEKLLGEKATAEKRLIEVRAEIAAIEGPYLKAVGPFQDNLKTITTSLEELAARVERRKASLKRGDQALAKYARPFIVEALYTEWGIWQLYQAEGIARAEAEKAAAEKARKKEEAAAAKVRAKNEANAKKEAATRAAAERKAAAALALSQAKEGAAKAEAEKRQASESAKAKSDAATATPAKSAKSKGGDEPLELAPADSTKIDTPKIKQSGQSVTGKSEAGNPGKK